jgi:hypothetical protein
MKSKSLVSLIDLYFQQVDAFPRRSGSPRLIPRPIKP